MVGDDLFKRLSIVYFFMLISMPISYLVRILYARTLSIEAYGLFYAMVSLLVLIGVFNDVGMKSSIVHFLPKFVSEKANKKIKSAISILLTVEVISAILISSLLFLFKDFLSKSFFHTPLTLKIMPIFALVFVAQAIFTVVESSFKGFRKEVFYSSTNPLRLLVVLLLSFLASVSYKGDFLIVFSLIWLFSYVLIPVLLSFPLIKLLPKGRTTLFDLGLFSKMSNYGFFVMVSSAASVILGKIDVLMLIYFRGVSEVAFYEVALPIASILLISIQPLTSFLFPQVSHFYHKKQFDKIKSLIKTMYNTGLFIFLPLGLVFLLFPKEIILLLFGSKFLLAKIALQILSVGFIFKGLALFNFVIADGVGLVKKKSRVLYLGVILNVLLNIFLIPRYGIEGAALATSISFVFMFIMSLALIINNFKISLPYKHWLKTISNSILFVYIVYILKNFLDWSLYLEATTVVLVAGLIYLIVGFKWKIINYKSIKRIIIQKFNDI